MSGTRAERYQVVLHVEPATLEWGRKSGRSELEDGTNLSAETSRRLSCDASVVRVQRGHDGAVLDVGRRTRTIPPALRRALEVRDRGCRFGIEPDWRTSAARYWREQDIPWPLIVRTIAALEASIADDERAPAREQTAA